MTDEYPERTKPYRDSPGPSAGDRHPAVAPDRLILLLVIILFGGRAGPGSEWWIE